MKIGIVSVGLGNIASVKNMVRRVGFDAQLYEQPPEDEGVFDLLFLPGVGSYDNGVKRMKDHGWYEWLKTDQNVLSGKTKIIGICLGMQLLCNGSEEGDLEGLGLIPGFFKRFSPKNETLKVPNMGWNTVSFDESKSPWVINLPEESRFYFVHSYYYSYNDETYVLGKSEYGIWYASAIIRKNIMGFQFHPEKSHKFGMTLLQEVFNYYAKN